LPDAGVIELRAEGRQAGFDVAQTFAHVSWANATRGTVRKRAVFELRKLPR
jgi:hypothetical protein